MHDFIKSAFLFFFTIFVAKKNEGKKEQKYYLLFCKMLILLKKELTIIIASKQMLVIVGIFLLISGLFLWFFSGSYNLLEQGYSSLDGFFILSPVLFLIIVPALTMRSFAEERKSGTAELLFTKPIHMRQIVLSKFFAVITIIFIAILLTLIYAISIYLLGNPVGNIDFGTTTGGYIAIILIACLFSSIGIFTSSLSNNQIIAFITGVFLCTFFYWGFELFVSLFPPSIGLFIKELGILPHYQTLTQGIVDSRDIIYFIVWITFFLALTTWINKRSR